MYKTIKFILLSLFLSLSTNLYAPLTGCKSVNDDLSQGTLAAIAQITGGEKIDMCPML